MKSVLLSVRPQWVSKILNREKTIEIRKKFPKDYVGWVYIYCTSHKNYHESLYKVCEEDGGGYDVDYYVPSEPDFILNGKVIARFWCDKVEEIEPFYDDSDGWFTGYIAEETWNKELLKKSCLTEKELDNYLKRKNGYAIHITKLEIFDKPKELREFWNNGKKVKGHNGTYQYSKLTRAPQSWQFIEV